MYEWFEVEHLRCFKHLRVGDLARINLVAGRNNVGKTALLEAFFIHSAATNLDSVMKVDAFRGIALVRIMASTVTHVPWYGLFFGLDTSRSIWLRAGHRGGQVRELRLSLLRQPSSQVAIGAVSGATQADPNGKGGVAANVLPTTAVLEGVYCENAREVARHYLIPGRGLMGLETQAMFQVSPSPQLPPFPGYYLTARRPMSSEEAAQRLSGLELEGRHTHVVEALRIIEPGLRKLSVLVRGQYAGISGDVGLPQLVPLNLMGGGYGVPSTASPGHGILSWGSSAD